MTAVVVAVVCLACVAVCGLVLRGVARADQLARDAQCRRGATSMAARADWLGLVNAPYNGRRTPDTGLVRPAPRTPRVLDRF